MPLDVLGSALTAEPSEQEPPSAIPPPRGPRRRRITRFAWLAIAVVATIAFDITHQYSPPEGPPPTAKELDLAVRQLETFASGERGLELKEAVPVSMVDEDTFEERLVAEKTAHLNPGEGEDGAETLYKALGILEPDQNLADELRDATRESAQAFYSLESKEILVREGELTPYVKKLIVHELVHALDDQHFGLEPPEAASSSLDAAFAFHGLVEASAEKVAGAWESSVALRLSESDRFKLYPVDPSLDDDAPVVELTRELTTEAVTSATFPSQDGQLLNMDKAFGEPPTSSEHIIDVAAYEERQEPKDVPPPDAEGEADYEGAIGRFLMEQVLAGSLDKNDDKDKEQSADQHSVATTSQGWGGDAAVAWRDGNRACARFSVVGDAPEGSDAFKTAWSQWAKDIAADKDLEVTVEQPASGKPVTVTSCSR